MATLSGAIIQRLETQEKSQGKLPEILSFYKGLLSLQEEIQAALTAVDRTPNAATAQARRLAGEPLLNLSEMTVDWEQLRRSYLGVKLLMDEFSGLFKPLSEELRHLSPAQVFTPETLAAWFQGENIILPERVSDDEQAALSSIFSMAFKPFIAKAAAALQPYLNPEEWRRGYCPVCGGSPDLAYLSRDNGSRWLVCSRCDTEWLYQRLQCPHCDNQDPKKIFYFTDEQKPYRLYVCEQCKRYLKAVDLRLLSSEVLLPLERLLTLDIDRQAVEKGYH